MDRSKHERFERSKGFGADFLQLDITQAPRGAKTDWLAERLRRAILQRRLPPGTRLPPSRVLAAELGVSRGVVTDAYRRLSEDGHVTGRGRGGTVVADAPTAEPRIGGPAPGPSAPAGPAFPAAPGPEIFETLRRRPAHHDLNPGVPDLAAFPRSAWLRGEREVLSGLGADDLGYPDPRGAPPLRRAVAVWLARTRGIAAAPEEVLVTTGTAQALALAAQVLRGSGLDAVAVEDPGSLGTRRHLDAWGVATPPVPVDDDGLSVGGLRACGAPAVLTTPAHQFPTGAVLSGGRRRELLRWAAEGGVVIEDDYDAEHRYDRPPVPALHSLAPERVVYAGSVSKLLAPALRVGWLLAPPAFRAELAAAKRHADLGNAVLPQLVLAHLMDSGALERHLRRLRRRHRARRDAMIAALRTHLPRAMVHGAAAGLHLTLTFEAEFSDLDLAAAALARGVKVQPLSWHRRAPGRPGLVLGYAACTEGDLAEAVAGLGRAVDDLA